MFLDNRSNDKRPRIKCSGVTGQNIPKAELYPRLKRPRLDYTRVHYRQFIPPLAKLYTHDINQDINNVERNTQELFNFSTSY